MKVDEESVVYTLCISVAAGGFNYAALNLSEAQNSSMIVQTMPCTDDTAIQTVEAHTAIDEYKKTLVMNMQDITLEQVRFRIQIKSDARLFDFDKVTIHNFEVYFKNPDHTDFCIVESDPAQP